MNQANPKSPRHSGYPIWLIVGAFVIFALFISKVMQNSKSPALFGTQITWERDFNVAFETAHLENKSMLLFFAVDWCPHCKRMKATSLSDLHVKQATLAYTRIYVDADLQNDVALRYAVKSYPTMILTNSNGTELKRFKGFASSDQILNWLQQ